VTAPIGILDAASLGELRAFTEQGMTATCTVQRRTTTGGSQSVAWAAVAGLVGLDCSFRTEASDEQVAADAVRATTRFRVRFRVTDFPAGGAGIQPQDRLVITHNVPGLPSPLTLSVVGALPKNADEVTRRVLAELVAPGGA